ncbi:MAG: TIGR00730 family Rossman fold protein [Deltaproteobacteria bacterium]|nr:TIGR00730 family Rossman fold protein [Deltaproteobacteria bacterium]
MKRICVFCGSSPGNKPAYITAARQLGEVLVREHLGLVYGGGNIGLMGEIARTVFKNGGDVIGVIPGALAEKELAYRELSDLRIVSTMHERKALMAELSDAFIALPGGLGTIEEFFEVLTWAQLGMHKKPCGILNIEQYFDHLMRFLEQSVQNGFIKQAHMSILLSDNSPDGLVKQIKNYTPPNIDKVAWILDLKSAGPLGNPM